MYPHTEIKVIEIKPFTRVSEIPAILGLSRSAFYTRLRNGALPPLQMIGGYGIAKGYNAKTLESILNGDYFNERAEV